VRCKPVIGVIRHCPAGAGRKCGYADWSILLLSLLQALWHLSQEQVGRLGGELARTGTHVWLFQDRAGRAHTTRRDSAHAVDAIHVQAKPEAAPVWAHGWKWSLVHNVSNLFFFCSNLELWKILNLNSLSESIKTGKKGEKIDEPWNNLTEESDHFQVIPESKRNYQSRL
jgi:hypothetical protein